jgi:hypothetical protein
MNIMKDGFQVRKIDKSEVPGAIAPIYLLGLPGDLDKLSGLLVKLEIAK